MTESEIVEQIKTEIEKTIKGSTIEVIKRTFIGVSKYKATIAVIAKDKSFTPEIISSVITYFIEEGNEKVEVLGTSRDLRELDFEVLTIDAEINLI